MSEWLRRDRDDCGSATHLTVRDNGDVHIRSDRSYALFWQIPRRDGTAMDLDPEQFKWLRKCDRPPMDFNNEIESRGAENLLEVTDTPWFSWRWKVDVATVKEQRLEGNGKLKSKYDDFPAKIGISILKKGSTDLREVAYVWSRHLDDGMMFWSETTIIPLIWKLKWGRFVAESGTRAMGRWVSESRNVYDDYRKMYPDEEPGRIVRIYVSTDSDNTDSESEASYADFRFSVEP